jgi:hypothetical protein
MTVLYTETHLTTSPIYHEGNSASFSIALSSLTLQCHIHREENIIYLRENEVIQGDLVQLSGVFVTNLNEPHFIKVHSIMLSPKDKLSKKRKLEELQQTGRSSCSSDSEDNRSTTRRASLMSLTSSSFAVENTDHHHSKQALATRGIYQEMNISFSHLFFILYGQATFLTEQYGLYYKSIPEKSPAMLTKDQTIRSKIDLLLDIFRQIYDTSLDLSAQIKVINFVSNVRTFTEKLNELKDLMPEGVLPPGVSIDKNVLLPSQIFQNFTRQ